MKKLTVYFFAILAVLLVFKAGCSDINRSGIQDEVDGIKAVVPAQGPYGARVLIEGKGFTNNPSVLFNGVEAMIETANDSSILTRVPYEATTGPLEVVAGQALFTGPNFSIDSTRTLFLVIDEIRPATARYRDTVYIAGTGFDPVPDANEVYFNDLRAEVEEAKDTVLVTTVPFGAESGLISVVANQDTAIGPELTLLRHQISELDPSSGRVGTQVRINGTNFSDQISENSVFFNGVQGEVLESSTDQLIASVPIEATTGPVSVAVRRDTVEGPTFSIQELQILEVAPLSGEVGTEVLISGNGFSPVVEENTIQFNGVSAPVLSASETELQTRVPEGATNGNITVSVNGMSVTGPEFMVEQGVPVIASVEPQSGLIGDDVTITGSNFSADTAEVSVLFNEVEAEILSSTETEIQTRVPQGATNGPITVSVNGKSATGPDFEVITTGTLIVEITTTGADVDTDGYTLTINAGDAIRTEVNDTITRSGLQEGEYEILLGDIETNCYLTQDLPNPRTAFVEAGATTMVNYVITCEGVNEPPVAVFATACNGLTCDLDASGSSDPDGSITAFDWILGDGSTATGEVVSHTYETSGTYSVELTVTDNENATHSVTQDVTVTVPEIIEVSPLSGVPGSTVLISGANFSATASENNVQFNGVRAELNSASETELSAIVPGDATTGPITVTVNGYTAQGPEFTVEAVQQPKTLQVVINTQGSMQDEDGYTLSVSGQDDRIVKPNDNVMYSNILENSVQVELTGVADNCVVEGDNPRSVNLDNSDNWGYTEFTVTCSAPAPEIISIDPTSGPTGTEVTITGLNFSAVASENNVQFNGERAELNSASETQLVAIVPGAATSGPVTVEVNGQTATGPEFTVIVPKKLYVNAETTNPVSDGYTVLVSGFDNRILPANGGLVYENILADQVTVDMTEYPSGCSLIAGENPRTVNLDNESNEATTTYYMDCSPPAPTIESITPTSGGYGTFVTITGTNFSTVNMDNDVRFNGKRAELNFVSETEIEAIVPWQATSGPVTVTVNGQTATGPDFTVIEPKTLEVITNTTGFSLDENGYTVSVSEQTDRNIAINDTLMYYELFQNEVNVELLDVAQNCTVDGANPRTVNLDNLANEGTTTFNISCVSPPPTIESIDPASGEYGTSVTINGSNFSPVASENNVQFNGDRAELNSVSETEIIAIVPWGATSGPVTVTVDGQTATGPEFTVLVPKTLYVNAETTNPVSDSYTVLVSGFDNRQLPVNGGIIYENILSGQVDVELTDYPSGCSLVVGENPRTVNLDNEYNEATTNFYLDCSPPAPTIESINPTSGGYGSTVTITGTNFSTVNMENDVRFNGTRAELNFVSATEIEAIVPWNATSGPVTVTVGGQTATGPNFNVVTTGSVEVNVKTTGTNIDPNGYQLFFDKEGPTAINVNDQYVYTNVEAGSHALEITDIASNCMINSGPENPYTLYVESGATLSLNYELYCEGSESPEKILFHGGDKSTNIFMMDPDGANVIQLTNDAFLNINPVASYAGDKIAYVGGSDIKGIRLMDYDGTNQQPITGSELMNPIFLSWSPKDDAILFSEDNGKTLDLYSTFSDGTGLTQITNTATLDEVFPHWSPAGNVIIFVQIDPEIAGSGTIILANPDGTNQRKITEISGDYSYPRISPDGSRIAYVHMAGDCDQIFTMDLDGNNISSLTAETEFKCENIDGLDWSPDGTQIVFQTNQGAPGTSRMWVMPSNGSTSPYVITNTSDHPSELALPTWGNYKQ